MMISEELERRTIWAPYPEGSECPWCCLDHICPSNVAWIMYKYDTKWHLVRRAWLDDAKYQTDRQPGDHVRVDGMVYNRYRTTAECGVEVDGREIEDMKIRGLRKDCCPDCWERRF